MGARWRWSDAGMPECSSASPTPALRLLRAILCACVRVCVCVCARANVCVCVRARVRACVRVRVCPSQATYPPQPEGNGPAPTLVAHIPGEVDNWCQVKSAIGVDSRRGLRAVCQIQPPPAPRLRALRAHAIKVVGEGIVVLPTDSSPTKSAVNLGTLSLSGACCFPCLALRAQLRRPAAISKAQCSVRGLWQEESNSVWKIGEDGY